MIYDSQDQKDFIFKILRSYQCSYAESLVISQTHALQIQSGSVAPIEDKQALVAQRTPVQKAKTSKGVK